MYEMSDIRFTVRMVLCNITTPLTFDKITNYCCEDFLKLLSFINRFYFDPFSFLSPELGNLHNLERLDCRHNNLSVIPLLTSCQALKVQFVLQ